MTPFSAYHNLTGLEHQARFDKLASEGYRMSSLSTYGDVDNPLYAAVWVKKPGPAWRAVHGKTAQQYQELFNLLKGEGYSPSIISVTGDGSEGRFAGVFVKNGGATWTRFGLREVTNGNGNDELLLQTWNTRAKQNDFKLKWISTYGDGGDVRYAAIWQKAQPLDSYFAYFGDPLDNHTAAGFQHEFNLRTAKGEAPALISVHTDEPWYSAIWYGSSPWSSWIAVHGKSSSAYQASFNELKAAGYQPVRVQGGGGDGSDIRFAAIFAKGV
jgi:hypothetical protein